MKKNYCAQQRAGRHCHRAIGIPPSQYLFDFPDCRQREEKKPARQSRERRGNKKKPLKIPARHYTILNYSENKGYFGGGIL